MKLEIVVSGRVDIIHHGLPQADTTAILAAVAQAKEEIMSELDDKIAALQADVAKAVTVEESAVTLIKGFPAVVAQALADAGVNETAAAAAVAAIDASVNGAASDLAAAVSANTAAPAPAPEALAIAPASITGTAGSAVSGSFSASGGTAPYTFSADENWPADIGLDASGSYTGTPTAAETASSVVTVTDATGETADTTVSVSIAAAA